MKTEGGVQTGGTEVGHANKGRRRKSTQQLLPKTAGPTAKRPLQPQATVRIPWSTRSASPDMPWRHYLLRSSMFYARTLRGALLCQRPRKHSGGAPLLSLANALGEPVTRLSGRDDDPHHADVPALAIVSRSGYVPVGPEFARDCGIGGYCTDGADATCGVAWVNGGGTILTMRRTSIPKPWRILTFTLTNFGPRMGLISSTYLG
ncbi:hypothetical protein EDB83DRAFT_2309642 [Lactarius deliciosus]|nr:hypothetical protein EDB83DRAFT_2309642 [Lactarius deliciosus]